MVIHLLNECIHNLFYISRLWLNWIEYQTTDLRVRSSNLFKREVPHFSTYRCSIIEHLDVGPIAQLVRAYA